MKVIATVPPYARFVEAVAAEPLVSGVRLNTVLPVHDELSLIVAGLAGRCAPKDLWVDLKGRQLRVAAASYVPYHHLELSHEIEVETPCEVLLNGGDVVAVARRVEGRRVWLEDVSPVPLGAGMSVTITHPSLKVHGYLTDLDRRYVAAARASGQHGYLLSFVESSADVEELLSLDPEARLLAKIESRKGLAWVRGEFPRWRGRVGLIAARGDLYLELERPGDMVPALEDIVAADPDAVAASRLLSSLRRSARPTCEEICDVALLVRLGYRTLLLGDELGFKEETLRGALRTLGGLVPSAAPGVRDL